MTRILGCPIQKSSDQSLFASSPKLIAGSYVFHRFLTPRHPPFALSLLKTLICLLSYCSIRPTRRKKGEYWSTYFPSHNFKELFKTRTSLSKLDSNIYKLVNFRLSCLWRLYRGTSPRLLKGGDPAAASATATLLRLHPNHRIYRRRILPLRA